MKYTGKKHYDYELKPIYKEDLFVLELANPCWGTEGGYEWLKGDKLPENPEDIDLSKIIFVQFSTHLFFDLDKKPIPTVIKGEYCEGHLNDYFYDLEKMRTHLLQHPKVVAVSEITDNPYYSCEEGSSFGKKHLTVLALPTSELIQKYLDTKGGQLKDYVYGRPYRKEDEDYLDIKKFVINEVYP